MIRLDKYLCDMGLGSRKEIKELIKRGEVSVNGSFVRDSDMKINENSDTVICKGETVLYKKYRYFMLDKPEGYVCTSDERDGMDVVTLFPEEIQRTGIFPVGRLDKDTTGLLLMTNDGDFAHRVISPKHNVPKLYYAKTDGIVNEDDVIAFRQGITLKDGLKCLPAELKATGENHCYVTVMEGKYHQVKRMLASVGKPVIELRRLSIGELKIERVGHLGGFVELTHDDLELVCR